MVLQETHTRDCDMQLKRGHRVYRNAENESQISECELRVSVMSTVDMCLITAYARTEAHGTDEDMKKFKLDN
ncbi:hypothetical protein Ciccas_004723 [Cichlidogyrus casuarinus]|uniref:Uncharacterized protein n=1 Tax=Cichlidogyrus casuarinus TaxID=1844966 RepID=A0ABD2QD02_9PLAT